MISPCCDYVRNAVKQSLIGNSNFAILLKRFLSNVAISATLDTSVRRWYKSIAFVSSIILCLLLRIIGVFNGVFYAEFFQFFLLYSPSFFDVLYASVSVFGVSCFFIVPEPAQESYHEPRSRFFYETSKPNKIELCYSALIQFFVKIRSSYRERCFFAFLISLYYGCSLIFGNADEINYFAFNFQTFA